MVFTCLKSRREARKLAKHLAWSVLQETWVRHGHVLHRGLFQIRLDTWGCVLVNFDGANLWFPLFTDCCLKKAVRLRLTKEALVALE